MVVLEASLVKTLNRPRQVEAFLEDEREAHETSQAEEPQDPGKTVF